MGEVQDREMARLRAEHQGLIERYIDFDGSINGDSIARLHLSVANNRETIKALREEIKLLVIDRLEKHDRWHKKIEKKLETISGGVQQTSSTAKGRSAGRSGRELAMPSGQDQTSEA